MEFFEKFEKNPYGNLAWNIPEQSRGTMNIVGGNSQSFRTEVKIAEYLEKNFHLERVNVVLPDALKGKVLDLPNFRFLGSTESGSFADGKGLAGAFVGADFNILSGDLSKNAITGKAVGSACENSARPLLITRDGVDLVAENGAEKTLLNENVVFFASVAQLQKLLRAVYYPKMLLMSQSLVQVAEILHKFTLSYPTAIITLHNGQILVAQEGKVGAVALTDSGYSPIMFFSGELAARIAVYNLFNPKNFLAATVCAVLV